MIDFAYKEIAKIIELADYELERMDNRRPTSITQIMGNLGSEEPAFNRTEQPESAEEIRFKKEYELLVQMKDKLETELDKIVFKFGAEDAKNVFKSL